MIHLFRFFVIPRVLSVCIHKFLCLVSHCQRPESTAILFVYILIHRIYSPLIYTCSVADEFCIFEDLLKIEETFW